MSSGVKGQGSSHLGRQSSFNVCRNAVGNLAGLDQNVLKLHTHQRLFLLICSPSPVSGPFILVSYSCCVCVCRDDSAEVDVYNPQKNEWDKISPMNQVCAQKRPFPRPPWRRSPTCAR